MSYRNLLKMRCNVLAMTDSQVDGLVSQAWAIVPDGTSVRCFLDLNFIRAGKDPIWTPDSGTGQNRSGVLFLAPGAPALPGYRIQIASGNGPQGTFEITSSLDEAWTPRKLHHLECFVTEVDRILVNN